MVEVSTHQQGMQNGPLEVPGSIHQVPPNTLWLGRWRFFGTSSHVTIMCAHHRATLIAESGAFRANGAVNTYCVRVKPAHDVYLVRGLSVSAGVRIQ